MQTKTRRLHCVLSAVRAIAGRCSPLLLLSGWAAMTSAACTICECSIIPTRAWVRSAIRSSSQARACPSALLPPGVLPSAALFFAARLAAKAIASRLNLKRAWLLKADAVCREAATDTYRSAMRESVLSAQPHHHASLPDRSTRGGHTSIPIVHLIVQACPNG